MKRAISGLIAVLILLCSVSFAEIPDLTGLSAEELLRTKEEIERLLYEEGKTSELRIGTYIVGEDIAEGTYSISEYNDGLHENKSEYRFSIFNSIDAQINFQKALSEYNSAYNLAIDRRNHGEEYSYPEEIPRAEYSRSLSLSGDGSVYVNLKNGEVFIVMYYSDYDPSSRLAITKTNPLFIE